MPDNLVIPLLVTVTGVVFLAVGLFRRAQARSFKTVPCLPIGSLAAGKKQFVTGKAGSPSATAAPVSKTPCVFYVEKIDRKEISYAGGEGNRTHWERLATNAYGGFFLRDGSGTALVVPSAESADIQKPEFNEGDDILGEAGQGATRRSEQLIAEGEDVTVLGVPRPLAEFMAYLRRNSDLSLPSDLVAELVRLESEPGAALPCFFEGGLEKVADQAYGDYAGGVRSSGNMLLQLGAVLSAAGAGLLFYALKAVLPG